MIKKLATIALLAYSPWVLSEIQFGPKTCKKHFKDDSLEICNAAVKGEPKAQYAMARYFADPQNKGNTNFDYSFHWHLKLSRTVLKQNLTEPPYIEALYNTAVFYHQGIGIKKDAKKALFWFEKAAQKGSSHAMVKLAQIYELGIGTNKNTQKANEWLNKAISLDNADARVIMAKKLIQGAGGVEQDTQKGLDHLKTAAKNRSADANLLLGSFYEAGEFVDKNTNKAKSHYGEACRNNLLMACRLYYELDTQLEFSKDMGDG